MALSLSKVCFISKKKKSRRPFFNALIVHDFFKEQPIKSATVYYMRFILHDWDDEKSIEILKRIREAAGPSSTLIVWEHFVPNACYSTDSKTDPLLHPLVMPLTWLDMHVCINIFIPNSKTLSDQTLGLFL
jgi:hypothetical protein